MIPHGANALADDNQPAAIATEVFSHGININFGERLAKQLPSSQVAWLRWSLHLFFTWPWGEAIVAGFYTINLLVLTIETDNYAARDGSTSGYFYVRMLRLFFLVAFVCELGMKLFAYQVVFFASLWNCFDLVIILADATCAIAFASKPPVPLSALRILGLLRLFRSVRVQESLPQLTIMINSLIAVVQVVVYGCMLLATALAVVGMFAVLLIHPINQRLAAAGAYDEMCERCPRAFESVFASCLTIAQQLIAGDDWPRVSIAIIEDSPWTGFFFAGTWVVLQLMLLNLILSVVIDTTLRESEEDTKKLLKAQDRQWFLQAEALKRMARQMDWNQNGTISREELYRGYEYNKDFRNLLDEMGVQRTDLEAVFSIVDKDNNDALDYNELVNELYKFRAEESHTLLVMTKFGVAEVKRMVEEVRGLFANFDEKSTAQLSLHVERIGAMHALDGKSTATQELRELHIKNDRRQDEMFQQLRELSSGGLVAATTTTNSSLWRLGVAEAANQQTKISTGLSNPMATHFAREFEAPSLPLPSPMASPGGSRGKASKPEPSMHDESNQMPCWRINNGDKGRECIVSTTTEQSAATTLATREPPKKPPERLIPNKDDDANLMPCLKPKRGEMAVVVTRHA